MTYLKVDQVEEKALGRAANDASNFELEVTFVNIVGASLPTAR